ncbi:MAG: succinate dehydrogenase, cytochrome b556 subunit [Pseudomonadota bacterium]
MFRHRVSGVLLAVCIPFLGYALSMSLGSPEQYIHLTAWLRGAPGKMLLLLLAWSLAHHIAAGVRHLLFDAGIGTNIHTARISAWIVHGIALLALICAAGALLRKYYPDYVHGLSSE